MSLNKTKLSAIIAIALFNTAPVMAAQVQYANFTAAGAVSNFTTLTAAGTGYSGETPSGDIILGGPGYTLGAANDVTFTWDGTLFTAGSDYTGPGSISNAGISSPTPFFSTLWTAQTVQLFGPGTYSFDTSLGGGNPEIGISTMSVGAGQIGMHLLFDWNGNLNIDILNVWNLNSTFSNCGTMGSLHSYTSANCLFTGGSNPAGNTANTLFTFASTDNDGDGTLGIPMTPGGPFSGFNFNFNLQGTLTTVPIPGAAWLFGSGLLGLIGVARHRKT